MSTIKFKNSNGEWEEITASRLTTPRNINGVPFDGSQDITIPTGSNDYQGLTNKPKINGVELDGEKTLEDLSIEPKRGSDDFYITNDEKNNGGLATGMANPSPESWNDLSTINKAITILDENLIKVTTDLTSTTKSLNLLKNEDVRLGTLTSLTLSLLPPGGFTSSISFTSGTTATMFSYPVSLKWIGTDCSTGSFIPVTNKRYNIIFWFDGVNINAVVGGFL